VIGGYNCNQLLDSLDYDLIKNNPKILCGFSDITALSCAIYKMASMVTFSGPHFSTFGCIKGMNYTIDYFKKCFMTNEPISVMSSANWSDDEWYLNQENRTFLPNDGFGVINHGKAEGIIVGGNLCTLNLLHGTWYMPNLTDTILFIEDDYLVFPEIFDRDLQSLVMQPGFEGVKGIVIGRFQRASKITFDIIVDICLRKKELLHLPIIANADFGHTMPMFTFPIGGRAILDASTSNPSLIFEW
jgi:muramoyltetrapeptide carboxypeptidase